VRHTSGSMGNASRHMYYIKPAADEQSFEFSCLFSKAEIRKVPDDFALTAEKNRTGWAEFWSSGGAVDFSECTDHRSF